jgi:heme a synthase
MAEMNRDADRQVGIWLLVCCVVLLSLILLGAATRLTGSGLSIVHWQPITGVWPPIGEAQWGAVFDQYRASPEYQQINRGMSMGEFKVIFYYEYFHRLLARALGLAFAVPLVVFWLQGKIAPWLRWPLVGLLMLGMAQGYMGWYMVKSGLVDVPMVSQYRLAAHLALALLIYAGMFWLALRLLWPHLSVPSRAASRVSTALGLVSVTILSGAFVAGLKAGYIYNTFPLMGGRWIPEGLFHLRPAWLNLFENMVAVQFTHRLLGISTVALAIGVWLWARRQDLTTAQHRLFAALAGFAVIQAGLGIATLVLYMPIWLAVTHQGGAVVLLSVALTALHLCIRPARVSTPPVTAPRLSAAA